MIIKYLPSNPKLRAFAERALEFLRQVYKDRLLARLEFVAFSTRDPRDVEEAEKLEVRFALPHYDHRRARAVVVEDPKTDAFELFTSTVQEVTHHVLHGPRVRQKVVKALLWDVPDLTIQIPMRRLSPYERQGLAWLLEELHTKYIVYNYFVGLNDKPVPVPQVPRLLDEYRSAFEHVGFVSVFARLPTLVKATKILEDEMAGKRNPFANFTATIHEMFAGAIKRFPVEVYNSNPSRYEVLYRRQRVDELVL
jgi:hypothetical protein